MFIIKYLIIKINYIKNYITPTIIVPLNFLTDPPFDYR
jgi:hypothetical protein